MTIATPPRERGFTAGLYGKKRNTYPANYTADEIRIWLEAWGEGNDEARIRRQEAKRVSDVGYQPGKVAVKGRNGKVQMMTHEQYNRHIKRVGHGA